MEHAHPIGFRPVAEGLYYSHEWYKIQGQSYRLTIRGKTERWTLALEHVNTREPIVKLGPFPVVRLAKNQAPALLKEYIK